MDLNVCIACILLQLHDRQAISLPSPGDRFDEADQLTDTLVIARHFLVFNGPKAEFFIQRFQLRPAGEIQRAGTVLQETLDEEGETDKTLTKLAMKINVEANTADEQMQGSNGTSKKAKAKPLRKRIMSAVGL